MHPANTNNLPDLLSSASKILHRTVRWGFEKRIVESNGTRYVLYRFYTPWQARHLSTFLSDATGRNLLLQKMVYSFDDWRTALKNRGFWVVTDYIKGKAWAETVICRENATSLAKNLAGLHTIVTGRPGRLTGIKAKSPSGFIGKIRQSCQTAISFSKHQDDHHIKAIVLWMESEGHILDSLPEFQLTHGDLNGNNLIVMRDGEVAFIDYELFTYGISGLELCAALIHLFCGDNRKYLDVFLDTYLKSCSFGLQLSWFKCGAQFLIFQLLIMAHGRIRRFRILKKRGQSVAAESCLQQFQRHMEDVHLMIGAFNSGQRNPQRLLAIAGR